MSISVRVLLVEDNEVYRSSLELLLGMRDGLEVVAAVGTAAEALECLAAQTPDVMMIDLRLPDMSGVDTAKAVRASAPTVALVCLTAEVAAHERAALLEAGAHAIVEKGEPIDALVALVRAAVLVVGNDR